MAEELVKEKIKEAVKGQIGSLVTDGATLKHDKAVAIMFLCNSVPYMLSLVFPSSLDDEEGGKLAVYNFEEAAEDVRRACREYGIDEDNCVCIMGDNVPFNDALAREMGLVRGKCLVHALALQAKHGAQHIPDFKHLVFTAGGLINAGGGGKKREELIAAGLQPSKMVALRTRFMSHIDAATYRAANFAEVKKWHTTSKLLVDAGAADVEEVSKWGSRLFCLYCNPAQFRVPSQLCLT
jgi:hypothetical protein